MGNHKYTEEDIKYICKHYGIKPLAEIADYIGVTERRLTYRVDKLRKTGYVIKDGRLKFSRKQDEYIINNHASLTNTIIGIHLGFTREQIRGRIRVLREKGFIPDAVESFGCTNEIQSMKITDGYPTVPWHMRQSTRSQRLTLDWESDKVSKEEECQEYLG